MSSQDSPQWTNSVATVLEQRKSYSEDWRRLGFWLDKTLLELVEEGATRWPTTRLIYQSETQPSETTLELAIRDARQLAALWSRQGLQPSDVIVIQVPHWQQGMVAWLAALHLGLVVIPLVHIYGARELEFVLRQSRAKMLVTPDRWGKIDYIARFAEMGKLPDLQQVLVIGQSEFPIHSVVWEAAMHEAQALQAQPGHKGSADDVAVILYTSGTTSVPKGALHTHNTLGAELKSVHNWWPGEPPRPALASMPAGHIAGFLIMMRPFVLGEDSIHIDHWDPEIAASLVRKYGIKTTTGTPYHASSLFDAAGDAGIEPLCDMLIGGASVPPSLVERAESLGVSMARSYGSTEQPTISTGRPEHSFTERVETDGSLMDLIQVRLLDDDDNDVTIGVRGEVTSMGPDLFAGYFDSSLNEEAFTDDGWFRTGDIGVFSGKNLLTIVDRKKDIIIRNGENISSREVEDILSRHPSILEAAVTGWPDATVGERVGAFLMLAPGRQIHLEDIRMLFAEANVAIQKTPEHIMIVDEFPRTPAGKVKKTELRKMVN